MKSFIVKENTFCPPYKIENSPSFKELWQINYPEAKLSARRKNQKRELLNQKYFSKEFQRKVLGE